MSRSYKKHPYWKIGDTSWKKIYNRKFRRSNKFKDISNGNAYRKVNETWNIADFITGLTWPQFKKHYWDAVPGKYYKSQEDAYIYWKTYYKTK